MYRRPTMMCYLLVALALLLPSALALPARPTRTDIIDGFPATHAARFKRSLANIPNHRRNTVQLTYDDSSAAQSNVYSPINYGADPTGASDSTAAFQALMKDLLGRQYNHSMADGFTDLGGAVVDLEGGDYTISDTIVFPPCYGNARIQRGTLRASDQFPLGQYLIRIGNDSMSVPDKYPTLSSYTVTGQQFPDARAACHQDGQAVYMENIGVEQILLDGNHRAAGGVVANRIMGSTLSELFIIHFTVAGVTAIAGHEVELYNSWIAQFYWDEPGWYGANGTGVQIFGNDHLMSEVIVFSSAVGVHIIGAANLVDSTHTWNKAYPDGIGIYCQCAGYTQNRIVSSYMDYNYLVAEAPEHLVVTDAFMLSTAAVELRTVKGQTSINGLTVTGCEWDSGQNGVSAFVIDETRGGPFTSLTDVLIEGNQFAGTDVKGPSARAVIQFNGSASECIDLTNYLLFPQFALTNIQTTLMMDESGGRAPSIVVDKSKKAPGVASNDTRSVCIQASDKIYGAVYIEVDQATRSWPHQATKPSAMQATKSASVRRRAREY